MKLLGQLLDKKSGQALDVFDRYKVVIEYSQLDPSREQSVRRVSAAEVAGNGEFVLFLPDIGAGGDEGGYDRGRPLAVVVSTPDSELRASLELSFDEFRKHYERTEVSPNGPYPVFDTQQKMLQIPVEPKVARTLTRNPQARALVEARIKGSVIDRAGRFSTAGKQIILWAKEKASAEFKAVARAVTDNKGNFYTDYPPGKFFAAQASVSVDPAKGLPIELDAEGFLPHFVYLVIDFPAGYTEHTETEDDCACHGLTVPRLPDAEDLVDGSDTYTQDIGSACVNFTRPNRTLEEFSFYMVARTTEPEIRGSAGARSEEDEALEDEVLEDLAGSFDGQDEEHSAATGTSKPPTDIKEALSRRAVFGGQRTIERFLERYSKRKTVKDDVTIDWEKTTADQDRFDAVLKSHEATSIAHGHLLHFKQVWKADGYSLGDLLYSLPLAPGQKKQLAVFDWGRDDTARRAEETGVSDALSAVLDRNRDINEIVNATLRESAHGHSESTSTGAGFGSGAAAGGSGGGSGFNLFGGITSAMSFQRGEQTADASQDSSRTAVASALNRLRDVVSQSASSVRNQRSTVITNATQGERMNVQTEVVANHNHCHALTMQYFEVLRHFVVEQKLVDVQECLFVPLPMSRFDEDKAWAWKDVLETRMLPQATQGLYPLTDAFNALDRKKHNYEGYDFPQGRYADETIEYLHGSLTLRFDFHFDSVQQYIDAKRREEQARAENTRAASFALSFFFGPLALLANTVSQQVPAEQLQQEYNDRLQFFYTQIAPAAIKSFVDKLQFTSGGVPWEMDATLLNDYRPGQPVHVALRLKRPNTNPLLNRGTIKDVKVSTGGLPLVTSPQPPKYWNIEVGNFYLNYRTQHIDNGLLLYGTTPDDIDWNDSSSWDAAPLNHFERLNPRLEDDRLRRNLLAHLNDNIEYYHKVIWLNMDANRRFMLLDGVVAPHSGGRSVASVAENNLIGVVGNSMVMPVARGFHLDPTYRLLSDDPATLLDHYQPTTPPAPYRISVPTRGVFCEAVQGACNACEKVDDTRFWKWEEHPIDEPTPIQSVPTTSRFQTPNTDVLKPTPLAPSLINLQTAPAAPDPGAALSGVLSLIGKGDSFKDLTELADVIKGASEARQTAGTITKEFADIAAKLALAAASSKNIGQNLETLKQAEKDGLITNEQKQKLAGKMLENLAGGKSSSEDDDSESSKGGTDKSSTDKGGTDKGGTDKGGTDKGSTGKGSTGKGGTTKGSTGKDLVSKHWAFQAFDFQGNTLSAEFVLRIRDVDANQIAAVAVAQDGEGSGVAKFRGANPTLKVLVESDGLVTTPGGNVYTLPGGGIDTQTEPVALTGNKDAFAITLRQGKEDLSFEVTSKEEAVSKVSTEVGAKFNLSGEKLVKLVAELFANHKEEKTTTSSGEVKTKYTVTIPAVNQYTLAIK